jgi:hypothetical protein
VVTLTRVPVSQILFVTLDKPQIPYIYLQGAELTFFCN